MSHVITASLELKESWCRTVDDSIGRIERCVRSCAGIAESHGSSMDAELKGMLGALLAECDESVKSLKDAKKAMMRSSSADEVRRLAQAALGCNAALLKSEAFADAVLNSLHRRFAERLDGFEEALAAVGDRETAALARLLHRDPRYAGVPPEELISAAESKAHPERTAPKRRTGRLAESLRARMSEESVDPGAAEAAVGGDGARSPLDMFNAAEAAIADERLRRAALDAIAGSIAKRGFVVRRENVRRIGETDTVVFTASKPGGQRAEFRIDVDGRFAYRFDGYEGLACEKDIGPLERDLEEVYGFRLAGRRVVRSNPDRPAARRAAAGAARGEPACR